MNTIRLCQALFQPLRAGVLGVCIILGCFATECVAGDLPHANENERQLMTALEQIQQAEFRLARETLEDLLHVTPEFKLAQMIYGDLLTAMTTPLQGVGQSRLLPAGQQRSLSAEMLKRWRHYQEHNQQDIPAYLLEIAGEAEYVIVVDVADSRLYLFRNNSGNIELVNDFYASIGLNGPRKWRQGDQRTPLGVYYINGYISPDELPDLYGAGAFPISYPNEWDKKLGRTGYGIWLHGTPSYTFSRPPQASDGCVTLSNQDLIALSSHIDVGTTPVIIADGVEWRSPGYIAQQRQEVVAMLEQWKSDLENRDLDRFLKHYSSAFSSHGRDFETWAKNARQAYANARDIKINLSDLSIFSYPDENMLVATFKQDYQSDTAQLQKYKRQYWRREDNGDWKIIYEGPV